MAKVQKLKNFLRTRINEIDNDLKIAQQTDEQETDRLNLATMRLTFSNILGSYLNDGKEVPTSYMIQAQMYYKLECYDQAINNAKMSKKSIHSLGQSAVKSNELNLERIEMLIVKCLIAKGKHYEAEDLLDKIQIMHMIQEYNRMKCQVMVKLKKEEKSYDIQEKLEKLILKQKGFDSLEYGLFQIQKGRNFAAFKKYPQAIVEMSSGMNILIEKKYKNTKYIYKIYKDIAEFQRRVNDPNNQYTSLICAQAMARQLPNHEKFMIQLIHSVVSNFETREMPEKALNELLKVELLEKQIYGESSSNLGNTLRKIADLMTALGKKTESRKYEHEYRRVLGHSNDKSRNLSFQYKSTN